MKTVFQHIEHVKGKPHHIRKRVAFTAAGALTGLVALVWLVGNLSLGTFAISGSTFADAVGKVPKIETTSQALPGLAGAAAAFDAGAKEPAHIVIVDTKPAVIEKKVEQTVIPF